MKTYFDCLIYELYNVSQSGKIRIVARPEVRHDHKCSLRVIRVGEDLINGHAMIPSVADRGKELCDLRLTSLPREGFYRHQVSIGDTGGVYDLRVL